MANLLKDLGFKVLWNNNGVVELSNGFLVMKFKTETKKVVLSNPRYDSKNNTLKQILNALGSEEYYGIDGGYFTSVEDERRTMDIMFDEEPRYRVVNYINLSFSAPDSTLWNDLEELLQ